MRPFKECHRRKQGQLSHPGEADEGRYFRANGHEYGRWPEEGHDAVTGTSRGASATHLYCLDTQHDHGGHPRSRGAPVATTMASSVRCSRSIFLHHVGQPCSA